MRFYVQKDKANNQIYIGFGRGGAGRQGAVKKTIRIDDNLALDYDARGRLLGLDVGNATEIFGRSAFRDDLRGDELVGVAEAAKLFGLKKPNFIRDIASQPDFPKPVAELASGRIWWRSELEDYQGRTSRSRNRNGPAQERTMYRLLAGILAADELAFRQNALTYFGHQFLHRHKALRQPSIEEITIESIEEDMRLTERCQSWDPEIYVDAASALFTKYTPSLRSYLASVLSEDQKHISREITNATWVEALKRIQRGEFGPDVEKSFSRWLLNFANSALESNGIKPIISSEAAPDSDPLQEAVRAKRYEEALATHERAAERLRTEQFVLDYLSNLSSDEIMQFMPSGEASMIDSGAVAHAQVELARRLRDVEAKLR